MTERKYVKRCDVHKRYYRSDKECPECEVKTIIIKALQVDLKVEHQRTVKAIFKDLDNIVITNKESWNNVKILLRKKWCDEK